MQNVASNIPITVATGREQMSLIRRQLGTGVNISIEPCRRDTFSAIALVSSYLHEVRGVPLDEAVAICPADPYVDEDYFRAVLHLLEEAEREGSANLVLMGIEPTYPSEKYGCRCTTSKATPRNYRQCPQTAPSHPHSRAGCSYGCDCPHHGGEWCR
ncbi:MAG: hypothetical protein ACFNJO_05265 [Porphyromonas endodontalis]